MADYTGREANFPILGQVFPKTCRDLGAIITLTAQGAGTVLSSSVRGNESNPSSRGVLVTVVISAKTGTIDVVVTIRRYDKASASYIDLLSSVSLTATGTTTYIVHPDLTAAANTIAKDFIGEDWDVKVVNGAGTTPSTTATIGACLLP